MTLRIGNASGFYGDRFDAMREMLTGGELDVLTGDYLAELTMLILGGSAVHTRVAWRPWPSTRRTTATPCRRPWWASWPPR
jgi:hypothetical protein